MDLRDHRGGEGTGGAPQAQATACHDRDAPLYGQGGIRRAFEPNARRGGTNDIFERLYVDSGVLNPELLAELSGLHASSVWAKSRLRDRIDAVIAHEHVEAQTRSHASAEALAPDTALPIREGGRRILTAIAGRDRRKGAER